MKTAEEAIQPALRAAEQNDIKTLARLLRDENTPDLLQYRFDDGMTLPLIAAEQGYTQALECFLAHDSTIIDQRDAIGNTCAILAAGNGHQECLNLLIEADSKVLLQTNNMGHNAASTAIALEQPETLSLCIVESIQQRINLLDCVDNTGLALPLFAVEQENVEAIKRLLWHYPSLSNTEDLVRATTETIPLYAARTGKTEILRLCIEKNPDVLHIRNNWGAAPAVLAAENGHTKTLALCLEHSPHELHPNESAEDYDPAYWARHFYPQGNQVKFLYGSYVTDNTPVFAAALHGHLDAVRLCVETEPEQLNAKQSTNRTIGHVAAKKGHFDIVKWCYEKDPNFHYRYTHPSFSIAVDAAFGGFTNIVAFCIEKHPHLIIWTGGDIVSIAAERGYVDIVKLILDSDILQYRREESTKASLLQICKDEDLNDTVREYLHMVSNGMKLAIKSGQTEVLRYLLGINSLILMTPTPAVANTYFTLECPAFLAAASARLDTVLICARAYLNAGVPYTHYGDRVSYLLRTCLPESGRVNELFEQFRKQMMIHTGDQASAAALSQRLGAMLKGSEKEQDMAINILLIATILLENPANQGYQHALAEHINRLHSSVHWRNVGMALFVFGLTVSLCTIGLAFTPISMMFASAAFSALQASILSHLTLTCAVGACSTVSGAALIAMHRNRPAFSDELTNLMRLEPTTEQQQDLPTSIPAMCPAQT